MKPKSMRRSALSLSMAVVGGLPIGGAWAAQRSAALPSAAQAAKARTFAGVTEDTRNGPIQVSIVVKNKKIKKVNVTNTPDSARSDVIQGQAIPILVQETLQAQSAKINEVSGATVTSQGYIPSLQAAVKKARKAKALK